MVTTRARYPGAADGSFGEGFTDRRVTEHLADPSCIARPQGLVVHFRIAVKGDGTGSYLRMTIVVT